MAESTYNNQGLFSTHHLEKVIKGQTSDVLESTYEQIKQLYASIAESTDNLNEPQTEEQFIRPVLKILGHTFGVQPLHTCVAKHSTAGLRLFRRSKKR